MSRHGGAHVSSATVSRVRTPYRPRRTSAQASEAASSTGGFASRDQRPSGDSDARRRPPSRGRPTRERSACDDLAASSASTRARDDGRRGSRRSLVTRPRRASASSARRMREGSSPDQRARSVAKAAPFVTSRARIVASSPSGPADLSSTGQAPPKSRGTNATRGSPRSSPCDLQIQAPSARASSSHRA